MTDTTPHACTHVDTIYVTHSIVAVMFPFLPRKPMLGGKLGRKRKAEAAAAEEEAAAKAAAAAAAEPPPLHVPGTCTSTRRRTRSKTLTEPRKGKTKRKKPTPLAELRNGGPVERAIRSDLDNLRALYDEELARRDSSQPAVVSATTNNDGSLLLNSHSVPGSTFRLFKEVYRRGKFGIIHTRCIPPRSDRAEFAQMIYSACLGLLKDCLGNTRSSTGGGNKCDTDGGVCDDVGAASAAATVTTADDTTINNAIFALFALYTLYETCPLPEFPSLYDANNQQSGNRGTESSGDSSAVFSEAERAALTTLPLGLTGAGEQSRVIYRRAYKSPIRVGHGDYARIVQLQDLCLERKSYCECRRAESYINCLEREDDSIKDVDDQDKWRCQCSTAGDCLEIIHRLQSNESFDYCEYAGPCSVEGLAGSAEYFRLVVEPPADAPDNTQNDTILTNEDMVGYDAPVDLQSELDIGCLESIYAGYQKALESVSKAPQLQGSNSSRRSKQSKQTQLVQDALRPVLRTWQRNRSKPKSIVRLNSIQEHFEVGGEASPAYGWLPPTNEDENDDVEPEAPPERRSAWNQLERSQRKQDAPRRSEGATEPNNEEKTLESMNEEIIETSALPSASPSEPTSTVKFSLPRGISPSLEKGIRGALAGILGDIKSNGHEEETLPNVLPAPIGGRGDSHRYVDISMDLLEEEDLEMALDSHMDEDEETIITHHTGYSTIPPAGTGGAAIALRDLLSYAKEMDDEGEDVDGEEAVREESANEETSVISETSGVAKNMLGTLLSQAQPEIGGGGGGGGDKALRETPKETAKHKRRKKKTQVDVDDVSMVSVPSLAGTGENMLDKLLGQVQQENGDKPSKKSFERMETRISQKRDVRSTKRRRKQEQDKFDDGTSIVSAPPAAPGGGMLANSYSNTEIDDCDFVNKDSDHVKGNER